MSPHQFDLATIGADLPVAAAAAELERAIGSGAAVVTAPPGTGKTTYVPPLVANLLLPSATTAPVHGTGRVLLSQPRRVAVRAAAKRIATLDGSVPGSNVGFTVRGERQVGPDSRIEVLTPGVLLRRLLSDPELSDVSAVILDEVHERSVDGDLLLGMIADLRDLRDDLTVVAMSATLDAAGIADLLKAEVVDVPSAFHPLRLDYAPGPAARLDERGVTREFLSHIARLAVAEQASSGFDALVFLPGAREVDDVVKRIRAEVAGSPSSSGSPSVEVLPLHGQLPSAEQDRAVSGRGVQDSPRIIVSTSLAESSLTVPGVRLVIDSGLAREVRRDRGRDMTGLVTVSASRASAEQRAGRAARQGPGRAVRAYSEVEYARMPAATAPEILSTDLTDAALLLAAWGTPGGAGLRLLTPPPAASMQQAISTLSALDLVHSNGRVTSAGTLVAGLPVGVREARALLAGAAQLRDPERAAEIVAAVSDSFRDPGADLSRLLRELRSGRIPGSDRWRRETRRLTTIASAESMPSRSVDPDPVQDQYPAGAVVALARPEWIARRTGDHSRSYLLASGTRAALPENSPLEASEWIAVREVQRASGRAADGTGAVIRLAAALSEAAALEIGQTLRSSTRTARIEDGRVRVREERRLGAILLSAIPVAPQPEDSGPAFATHLREIGIGALQWTDSAIALRGRLGLLHRELGSPWPAMDDDALMADLDAWLGPDLARLRPQSSLRGIDVVSALRRLLPWPEATQLDALAPERLAVPSGSSARIDYPAPGELEARPVVAVKLQELFGLAETPRLAGGRVPVLFHLLSPAHKPLAITDDLASFWNGPYQDVRREMRGRYPKHPWPEDPWAAEATARTKRAQSRAGG